MLGFGVQLDVGEGLGVGEFGSVGKGFGGMRGSGKRGSAAAASTCVFFQSGPKSPLDVGSGTGVTSGLWALVSVSVASINTRSPMCSPSAIAATSTSTPAARIRVTNLFEEFTRALCVLRGNDV
jgi:hypothetical protein